MFHEIAGVAAAVLIVGSLAQADSTRSAPTPVAPEGAVPAGQGGPARTNLARLAKAMAPGTWAVLETEGLTGSLLTSVRGLSIMGWTDDAWWDGRTGQFLYLGMRLKRKFIAYAAATNTWREIPIEGAEAPPIDAQFGHLYGRNALDPDKGRFYHRYDGGKDSSFGAPGAASGSSASSGRHGRIWTASRSAATTVWRGIILCARRCC